MKWLDTFLQEWRYRAVSPYIGSGARVLDVGCFDGSMFSWFRGRDITGVGVDSHVVQGIDLPADVELIEGVFPDDIPEGLPYDVVTMLAVIEHVPLKMMATWVVACSDFLKPNGCVVITVPSPLVDRILDVLVFLKIADGMALEEHHGFDPADVAVLFADKFVMEVHKRFQFGLNHVFVLRKIQA